MHILSLKLWIFNTSVNFVSQIELNLHLYRKFLFYFHPYTNCRVHKHGVPRGPASTPGLGPGKQHVVHGPAQESKNIIGQKGGSVTDRKVYPKNKHPLVNFFGPPLCPEHSLRAPAASERSLQSEGLAQSAASYSDPTFPTRGP